MRLPQPSSRASLSSLIVVCSMVATAPADATQGTLEGLLQEFSRLPGLEAEYVEKKKIALLAVPLESRGRIRFAPPSRLSREVEAPHKSRLVIDGTKLKMIDAQGTKNLDVGANATISAFINSFTMVLAGDRSGLEKVYRLELVAPPNKGAIWKLKLTPRDAQIAKIISAMHLQGQGIELIQLRINEANGDESVMEFKNVNTKRRYDDAEIQRYFGVSK